jgi:hypothetical protein
MLRRILSYLAVSFVILLASCSRSDIDVARKAETEERFSDSYQVSSKILFEASKSFSLPEPKSWKSWNDAKGWIEDSVAAYTKYSLDKPKVTDLKESFDRLERIGRQLTYLENKLHLENSVKLSLKDFVEFFQAKDFSDQKIIPKIVRDTAADAYNRQLSIVIIKGDGVSYVDGGLYSEEANVSARYNLTHSISQLSGGAVLLLRPGRWVAVSRAVPGLSNPADKAYLELNDIIGRYAGTFFSVPNESHLMIFKFCLRPRVGMDPCPGG